MDEQAELELPSFLLDEAQAGSTNTMWAVNMDTVGYALDMLGGVTPEAVEAARAAMRADLGPQGADPDADEAQSSSRRQTAKPYNVADGIAYVQVAGLLTKRPDCMAWLMGMPNTTYIGLRRTLSLADADPEVQSKKLVVDSPGGGVSGCFDAADDILKGKKPTDVYVQDECASGAMLLAAGARHVSSNKNAIVGSVGVYTTLTDSSKMNANIGRQVHVVKAGRHKAIGVPGAPVEEPQLQQVQKGVDSVHSLFLRHVAIARHGMTAAKLASIADAGVYIGQEAVKAGLVDNVESMEQSHKRSVRLNSEGKKKQMNDNSELQAMLDGGGKPADVQPTTTPAVANSSVITVTNEDARLLLAVKQSGVKSAEDMHKLAASAASGSEAISAKREEAKRLAIAAFGQGSQALAGATLMIDSATNYPLLAGMSDMYTEAIKLRGLGGGSEPNPRVSASSYNNGGGPAAPVVGGDHNAPPPSQAVSAVGEGVSAQINAATDAYLSKRNNSIAKQLNGAK